MENKTENTYLNSLLYPEENPFIEAIIQFEQVIMLYNCAIKEVKTKLEILNDDLSIRYKRNPIEFIKTRVKTPNSIAKKLVMKNLEPTVLNIGDNIDDVAGVRVICSFIDDIYTLADMLINQDDITLIEMKDYIKQPKDNGYRSLHLIIAVPIFLSDEKLYTKVEVQIRTIAMDFWASLDHKLKYKKDILDAETIGEELRQCAEVIASTDVAMQAIKNKIYPNEDLTKRPDMDLL